jgi:hypothetical protein
LYSHVVITCLPGSVHTVPLQPPFSHGPLATGGGVLGGGDDEDPPLHAATTNSKASVFMLVTVARARAAPSGF